MVYDKSCNATDLRREGKRWIHMTRRPEWHWSELSIMNENVSDLDFEIQTTHVEKMLCHVHFMAGDRKGYVAWKRS